MEQSDVEKKFKEIEIGESINASFPVSNLYNAEFGYQWRVITNSVFGTREEVTYYGGMETRTVPKWNVGEPTIEYNQDGEYLTYTISYDGPAEVLEYHVEYNGETFPYESDTITLVDDSEVTAYILLQGNDLTGDIKIDLDSYTPEIQDTVDIGGKTYRTVTIGNQTWLAQNLDLETDSGSVESDRRSDNEDYGRLYQWDKAVEVADSIDGWHLPTRAEWDELYNIVGKDATYLKSKTEWDDEGKGTDDYGFSILPAGLYRGGDYYLVGINACFITSEEDDYDNSRAYGKDFSKLTTMDGYDYNKTNYRSVRLIKDN